MKRKSMKICENCRHSEFTDVDPFHQSMDCKLRKMLVYTHSYCGDYQPKKTDRPKEKNKNDKNVQLSLF
ncbi:hypothetical protein KNO36_10400 [Capnocytophaga canimorsus]|nr:hypothetical protein [Capnocytophaga canimorsus]